ncbi:Laeverin [Dactylella cylindrospora]|nr:Laeverin [Dactylella cylindrospora]
MTNQAAILRRTLALPTLRNTLSRSRVQVCSSLPTAYSEQLFLSSLRQISLTRLPACGPVQRRTLIGGCCFRAVDQHYYHCGTHVDVPSSQANTNTGSIKSTRASSSGLDYLNHRACPLSNSRTKLPSLLERSSQASVSPVSARFYATSSPSSLSSYSQPIPVNTNSRLAKFIGRHKHRQKLRFCSSRRHSMCRSHHLGGGEVSSSIDVTKGREVLPSAIKPVNYKVTLEPDFEKFTFDGTVVITLNVVEDTDQVVVNSTEIKIHSARLDNPEAKALGSDDITYNEDLQTATFAFGHGLKAGTTATLEIKYTGILNDNMAGFYRSSYKAEDGTTKYLATTQMEPTDCRKAFPSFDEPALKATFDITLVAEKNLTCLSNMNEIESKDLGNGKKAVTFATSPPMSTYLVAFIVGDLRYIETNEFRIPVRVYATPGTEHLGKFSLDLAAKTLKFYEDTFESPYPLPKMDMVAIPDFSAGAMENWGLVTYRLVDLLFDETTSGASTKQRVAEVVQHELAHQWFGNLVTMDFWDGLWLNEGFATWMSWYSCNVFYPEWKVWETYVADNLQSALSLDSLRSSHPIEVPVKKISEINQIFDAISYSKGSCVLRMVSQYIGEKTFIDGIKMYLKKHAYKNTITSDLWDALSTASGKDISGMMDVWTRQIGHPVVSVTETEGGITVKQNRFLRTADVTPEEDKTLYPIVLGLRTKGGVDEDVLLTEREKEIKLDTGFYKINANHSGIYRTLYPADRLEKLGEAAKQGLLTVEDRTGMVADAGALVASGHQKTSGFLALVKGFTEEKEYVVWSEILNRVGSIRGAWVFEEQDVKDGLKAFNKNIISSIAHELGWEFKESDSHIIQQFKALAFGSAGMSDDEIVVKAAQDMFAKFAAGDKAAIHPNLRSSVYAIALKNGGRKEWEFVLNAYHTGANSDERNTALRALGRSRDPQCIKDTLALSLSSDVKEQDIYLPLAGLRGHPEGIIALWTWAKQSWDVLEKKLPPGLGMLGSIVQIVTSSFTSQAQIDDINKFFGERSTKGFDKGLAQALDAVSAKAKWLDRDKEDVKAWLKAEGYLN